jgi:cytosine/adenosine deaminase-related metal-dependent hydrolase
VRTLVRADWVLPIVRPPVREGWVLLADGRVASVATGTAAPAPSPADADRVVDLPGRAVLPGLVNAHTHLELSWLRGRVPQTAALPQWVRASMALRAAAPGEAEVAAAARDALAEAHASGTALVGEVSNSLASCAALAGGPVAARVFHELLGFAPADPAAEVAAAGVRVAARSVEGRIRTALAVHAPYSTAPATMRCVGSAVPPGAPVGVHLAESADELRFLRDGGGEWRALLEDVGKWTGTWTAPGCGPVEYLAAHGLLRPGLVAAHGVHLGAGELARLARADATLVTCPRSNTWTGAGVPPVADFYESGVRVAIGTDSLASVEDLDLFAELRAVRRLAPSVPAAALLRSATLEGARALGWDAEFGSLEPGRRAALIAVRVPATLSTGTVEDELLDHASGPDGIAWVW